MEIPNVIARTLHVLVVDDDQEMQRAIRAYLEANDFAVTVADSGRDMQRLLDSVTFDLIILSRHLGRENGLDLLRDLRARDNLPVIIMTGHRRDEVDRVLGLELGADDYLIKPFSLRELLARIRAIIRRVETPSTDNGRGPKQETSSFGGWLLDRRRRKLAAPSGKQINLTKGEYALLVAFLDAPQRPLTREFLMQSTRLHENVFDRSIDVQILRLRRKLEQDPTSPNIIRTERGIGYVFTLPVEGVR